MSQPTTSENVFDGQIPDESIVTNTDTRHGADQPNDDADKGALIGGVGGAVTGAIAGSLAGPVGAVVGAVSGGAIGAGASGLAVGEVDKHDDDRTVSGVSEGFTP